ncbi:MAG: hypothetical protein ACI4VI_07050 [Acutalibacteraceae bacterium]
MKRLIALFICAIYIFAFSACSVKDTDNTEMTGQSIASSAESQSGFQFGGSYLLYDGIYITDFSSYSGKYVEDGSGDEAKDVFSVTLFNSSDKDYQLLDFSLLSGDEKYTFSAKTVLAGSKMILLESGRKAFDEKADDFSVEINGVTEFDEKPSGCPDELEINYADNIINVKNISGKELKNVYVYYKGYENGVYLGGITYRVSLGDIPPDTVVQAFAANFFSESSKIVFSSFEIED